MDRDAIERRDFPIGRRGYDQAAVDEHLRRVADQLEALRERPGVAAGTSDQVRVILEAAETGAAELRADAGRQAREHVARVQEAAGGMLARLDELERELGNLLEALRRSGERLTEGLARLHEQAGHVDGAVAPADEPAVAEADEPAVAEADEPAVAEADEPAASLNGDEAGARLIALNMALDGKPREETGRYLTEHFQLADPDALLDDVYARAGK
jgi:DivIVA domain-containing protein